MTVYNTPSDAANTAVRAFLTAVGRHYLGRPFNTGSGRGREDWLRIRDSVFGGACAYCGDSPDRLEMEHLVQCNRAQGGLHHPGNVVPLCRPCNSRRRSTPTDSWRAQLAVVCTERSEADIFDERQARIEAHIADEGYPDLKPEELSAIVVFASQLYENVSQEVERALKLHTELHERILAES